MKYVDFKIGNRYGNLVAVEVIGGEGNAKQAIFRCDCGNSKTARIHSVQGGSPASCGCLKGKSGRLPSGEAQLRMCYKRTKNGAGRRGHSFELTRPEFDEIVRQPCHYCGFLGYQKRDNFWSGVEMSGVDRIDSSKGYVAGNVVPCCADCNRAKARMSVAEFKAWVRRVYDHFGK